MAGPRRMGEYLPDGSRKGAFGQGTWNPLKGKGLGILGFCEWFGGTKTHQEVWLKGKPEPDHGGKVWCTCWEAGVQIGGTGQVLRVPSLGVTVTGHSGGAEGL